MKCNKLLLFEYIDNNLEDKKIKEFEAHLEQCDVCKEVYNLFRDMESANNCSCEPHVDFTEKIMNNLDENEFKNKKCLLIRKITRNKRKLTAYSVAAMIGIFILGGTIINKNLNLLNMKNNFAIKSIDKSSSVVENDAQNVSADKKLSSEQLTNFDIVDKDYIYDRMLNTVDFFKTAKGTYEYTDSEKNFSYLVEYSVRMENNPKSYEKIVFSDGNINETLYDGENISFIYNKDMTIQTSRVSKINDTENDRVKRISSKERIKTDEKGEKTYLYRQDITFTGYAKKSLLPQERVFKFLSDFNNWSIKSIEEYNKYNCAVLQGKLNDKNFEMWVDVNTGILLKYKCMSESNQLLEKLETKNIKLNEIIDEKDFEKDLSKYKY